jgi:hypothetical protein
MEGQHTRLLPRHVVSDRYGPFRCHHPPSQEGCPFDWRGDLFLGFGNGGGVSHRLSRTFAVTHSKIRCRVQMHFNALVLNLLKSSSPILSLALFLALALFSFTMIFSTKSKKETPERRSDIGLHTGLAKMDNVHVAATNGRPLRHRTPARTVARGISSSVLWFEIHACARTKQSRKK